MLRAVAQRLSGAALSLLILVGITFVMAHATPGGPAYSILGLRATPEAVQAVNARLSLTLPLWRQLVLWVLHVAQGNFGVSALLHRPVGQLIGSYALNTLTLQAVALAISIPASIAIGMLHGAQFRRWPGRIVATGELALYAIPSFFLASLLVLIFSASLQLLPATGTSDLHAADPTLRDRLAHIVLPVATIALLLTATLARYCAQSVHEELGRDYVRTAAAHGASPIRILMHHVLRNALRPLIGLLGLYLPTLLAGSVIVESVFSYPGLGWLLWRSALAQDYPVMIAIVLLIGVLTVLGNLLADLVNTLLDPRCRHA